MTVVDHLRSVVRTGRTRTRPAGVADGLVWLSRLVLAALTAAFALGAVLGASVPLRTQSWLYLGLMVGLSLPHGGFEHVRNLRGRAGSFQGRYLLAYVALLAVSVGLFAVAPAVGLTVAVAVTMVKGGHAGVHVLESRVDAAHLAGAGQRALGVAVRGGAVMTLGLAFHPGDFTVVASGMVRLFGGTLAPVAWVFAEPVRMALVAGWLALAVVHVTLGWVRRGSVRGWLVDAAETALLGAYFAVVPPIVAVGTYFPFWYATRNTARMLDAGEAGVGAVARWRAMTGSLRLAVLPWLGGVALFAALIQWAPGVSTTAVGLVAAYSVAVSAIGLPHVVVGSWLDRRQGIWAIE